MASDPGERDFDHSEIEIPTVVGLIRNILNQYPDSGQILKELIQNAEDARASEVEVVYTEQGCSTDGVSNIIKPFLMGGGISVYNDGIFRDADWQGIRRLSESIKRADPTTVGRFGLGFKSVFHITDYVTILSGNKVLFMNPCEPESRMCRVIHLSKLHQHVPDTVCLQLWGRFINKAHLRKGNFNGTIFWFPLRTSPSKLSENVYTHMQVQQLFDSFATEGSTILMFLRCLEKVSIQIKTAHEQVPSPYMVVELQSSSLPAIRTKRQEFCSKLDSYVIEETYGKVMCYYDITIRTLLSGKEMKTEYSILHYVSPKPQSLSNNGQWEDSQLPLVGVAAPLDEQSKAGQLFCFLPLPTDQENCTGLPVFVNGYFILNQNRRHVLWKSADIMHDKDVEWNELLVDHVLPIAYLELVKRKWSDLNKGSLHIDMFYQVIPSVCTTHGKWQILARKIWNALKISSIIYSDVKKMLLPIDQVIITNPLNTDNDVNKSVLNALIDLNSPLSTLPDRIWKSLCYLNWKVTTITPLLLLNILHEESTSCLLSNFNRKHLLEFVLSAEETHHQLDGLPLLPLANGSWVEFFQKGKKVYLCSVIHAHALVGIQHKIVDNDLTENVRKDLEKLIHKGMTQIVKLDLPVHGPKLVAESITSQHELNPDSGSLHKWLSSVWTLIQNVPLINVQYLTLIPTKRNPKMSDLVALNAPFIVTTDKSQLCDDVCFSLKLLGVNVIRLETYIRHSDLHYFMCDSTGIGIIKALNKSINQMDMTKLVNSFNNNRNEKNSFSLIESLPIEHIPNKVQKLLQHLEIFKATDHTGRTFLTSINKCSQVYPQTCDFPFIFHEETIHARNSREMRLIKHLGASLLTIESICSSFLKISHTKDNLETLAVYIMNNHSLKNNQSIQKQLKLIKFVPNQHGILCHPSDLYDPLDEYAVILGGDMLPHDTFHNFLPFLKKLGLKQLASMSPQKVTELVISTSKKNNQDSFEKASEVLRYINSHPDRNKICSMIRSVPCVPGSVNKASNYPANLHWNTSRRFYCPEEVKSFETFGMTLGSVVPMTDTVNIQGIADYFHWRRKTSAAEFVQHLKNVINSFAFTNALFIDLIRKCYIELYSFVNIESEADIINELFDLPCILTKHGLKRPTEVYLEESNGDLDLKPYFSSPLFKSQEELVLFSYLGCLKDQSKELYLTLLKNLHDNGKGGRGDLKMIVNILERLEDIMVAQDQERIFIPVEISNGDFELVPLTQCCYADHNLSWLNFDKENNHEVKIIHNKIDKNLAIALGVPPLQKQLLACGIPIMKWGQSQPLTSRLRDLLEQYRDGVAVLKELVQNADDAGAHTVSFLYDERQNEDCRKGCMTSMLGEVQGPALWAYNDREFSESDLENIIKLGGRTKEGESTKIGKFGLGFCSVYNLTDVPSFISGSNYIVFDPHMTYIERNDPGIRYDFSVDKNRKIIDWFGSQFKPFQDVFEYKNGCKFSGTLFRFPLRTPSQATRSEISNVAYGSDQIIQLLKMFMEMAGNLLLFSQNVKDIKIYHLNKNSSPKESKLIFHTKREVCRSFEIDNDLLKNVSKTSTQIQKVSKLVNCFRYPFKEIAQLDLSVNITSIGKSLCNLEEGSVNTSWIISWHSGGSELIEHAKILNTLPIGAVALPLDKQLDGWMPRDLETLPTGFYKTSHLHCFLPLPVETCFPVHINGYFEVASDRRSIKLLSSDDRSGTRDWNLELLCESIVPAYHNLLSFLRLEGLSPDYKYYSLWPLQKTNFDMLQHELARKFYKDISEKDIECFSDNGVWYSLSQSSFLEETFHSQEKVGELAFDFLDKYFEADDRKMIELPSDYIKELGDEAFDNVIDQEDFYLDYFIPNINENYIHEDERDELVLFALETGSGAVLSQLSNIECISTQPYGKLQKPGSLIDPDSKVSALFSDCDERFPAKMFLKSSHIKDSLCKLGMMQQIVPGEILIERAELVRSMLCAQCAIDRCKSILSYCSFINDNKMLLKNEVLLLKNIAFLPVESKPPNWECRWAGDDVSSSVGKPCKIHKDDTYKEVKLAKPSSLFTSSLKNLVGSLELILGSDIQISNVLVMLGVRWISGSVSYKSVIQQLHCVSIEAHDYNSRWLTDICCEIYRFLDTNLQEDNTNRQFSMESKADYDEYKKDIKDLQHEKVLLTKVGFHCANVFASNDNIDCSPDLFSTQNEILRWFPHLIKALEIKYSFGPQIVIEVLKLKGQTHKQMNLTEDDINQYSKLLIILTQELIEAKKSDEDILQSLDLKDICLPNKKGHLQPAGELCTDDGMENKTKRFSFIHPNLSLSNELTEALGIKTVTRKLLQESSDRIPFGQSEKLTTRIKNILEDYPCDEGIMKELLQNADDAGATEIAFLFDLRNHQTESLFDEKYAPLQGPALCIFNNSYFSADDLKSISNLGDSTKKSDPESTGQYGIGFNAVYHITDAPSFLTRGDSVPNGEVLCMFDPLCKYDPECTVQNPGVLYKNLKKLREWHPDSFKGYLEDDIMRGKGTLFRLPLRTDEDSEISKRTFKVTEIDDMVKKFKKQMHESLLFLKNVRKISIQKILPNGKRSPGYEVESSLDETGRAKVSQFKDYVKNQIMNSRGDHTPLCNIKQFRVEYQMDIKDSDDNSYRWHIVQQLGSSYPDKVPNMLLGAFSNGELKLLPHAGVAILLDKKSNKDVSHVISCYLPLPPKSGLPFSIHGHFALNSSRRDLWTGYDSIKGLWNTWLIQDVLTPSAANAIDYFRTHQLPQDGSFITEDKYNRLMESYYDLLPSKFDAMSGNWTSFVKFLYQYIEAESLKFFDMFMLEEERKGKAPNKKQAVSKTLNISNKGLQNLADKSETGKRRGKLYWHSLTGDQFPVYFQEPLQSVQSDGENQNIREGVMFSVVNTLKRLGMKIGSDSMFIKLAEAEMNLNLLTPDAVIEFLSSWKSENSDACKIHIGRDIEQSQFLSVKNVAVMIEFLTRSDNFFENISGLPLLVTQDNVLQEFSEESPVFLSEFYGILQKSNREFVHSELFPLIQKSLTNYEETQNNKNQTSHKISTTINSFKIPDFAERIEQEISLEYYSEDDKFISYKEIKERWLNRVWKFIESDMPKKSKSNILEMHQDDIDWCAGKSYLLEHLGKWALYPIVYKDNKYLIPIMHANKVLNFENERGASPFKKLPVAIPDFSIDKIDQTQLAPSLDDPVSVLNILDNYHSDICRILQIKSKPKKGVIEKFINKEDALNMMKYFSKHVPKYNLNRVQLKHLPFYEDISQSFTCIDEKITMVLPYFCEPVPEGIKEMAETRGCTILIHECSELEFLYEYLEFSFLDNILDLYSKFILPNFVYLHEDFHRKHLEKLNDHLKKLNMDAKDDWKPSEAKVVNQLQRTKFIKHNGEFKEARKFYAPFNDVFKIMQMSELPEEWREKKWKKFLIRAGITHEIQPDLFLSIARALSSEKFDVETFEDFTNKSKCLMTHFLKNIKEFEGHFSELQEIEFIVPETDKAREELLPHYRTTSGLISFSGSLPRKYAPIAWSASPILPSYADVDQFSVYVYVALNKRDEYFQSLGIHSSPLPWMVQTHFNNICKVANDLEMTILKRIRLEEMMDIIYFILNICEADVIQNLLDEGVPLVYIPDHKTFVPPTNVCINLHEEIVPYIYKFPFRYGNYLPLFKEKFLVEPKANCDHYAGVLSRIYHETQKEELSPEERRSVMLAIKGLVKDEKLLEKLSVTELYLPSRNGILVKSTDLYVADNQDLERCIENSLELPIFYGFASMDVNMDDALFVRRLPESVKPKFLTDVLVEELEDIDQTEISEPILEIIKEFLCTPEFLHSILRITNHGRGKGVCKEDRETIVKYHESVEVKQLESIETSYFFKGEKRGTRSKSFFVQTKNSNGIIKRTLYLERKCQIAIAKGGLSDVYEKILDITDSKLVRILSSVFDYMREPHELESYLDKMDLKSYGNEHLDYFIPKVGSYLDPKMIDLLDNGFYSLHENEIVAMEKYIQGENDEATDDDTFIIVQVKSLVKESKEIMQSEYEVDIGEDATIIVSASQLFKFVRNEKKINESIGTDVANYANQLDALDDSGFEGAALNGSNNSGYQPDSDENLSDQEILKMIKNQLIEIWKITNITQRRQLVRRLWLKWHPDKNTPNLKELCTQCFQYIQSLIARLERGETIPDEEDYSSAPKESPSDEWNNFFTRANSHFRSRNRHQRRNMADHFEALLWMKQAEHDFQAAQEELSQCGSSCWISYKCYEATKNVLISALYLVDREQGRMHRDIRDITVIASALLEDGKNYTLIIATVKEMEDRVNLCGNLRQPTHTQLPCESYQVNDANFMVCKAEIVIDAVKEILNE